MFKQPIAITRSLLLIFLGLVCLGQLQRLEIAGLPPFYLHEVLLTVLIVWSVVLFPQKWNQLKLPTSLILVCGVFALSLAVNASHLSATQFTVAGLYFVRFMLYLCLIPTLAFLLGSQASKIAGQLIGLMAIGLTTGGLVQYFIFPDARQLYWLGWDNHYYRSIGTLFDPNFLGLMMGLAIIFCLRYHQSHWARLTIFFASICLLLTYSRSSWISLVLVGLLWLIKTKAWGKAVFVSGIVVIALMLLPQNGGEGNQLWRAASIYRRLESSQKALQVFQANPIIGVGFNAYQFRQEQVKKYSFIPAHSSSPDNSFVLILATSGLVGLAATINLMRVMVRSFQKNTVALFSFLAVGVHSMFNNSLFYPWVLIWLSLLVLWAKPVVMENTTL